MGREATVEEDDTDMIHMEQNDVEMVEVERRDVGKQNAGCLLKLGK
jgi:hypothetical protein